MAHGDYAKRKASINHRTKSLGVEKKPKSVVSLKNQKKPKSVSLKNQIRSTERMLKKDLPAEVREAQEKKLEDLKKQQEIQARLAIERKIILKNKKIKFFDRRKIDRAIKRLEKVQEASSDHTQGADIKDQLAKLKEDLEYVKFFPKTEKYVSLFIGDDNADVVDRRNRLREQIKSNIKDAVASGKDLEETGNEDDGLLDMSEDDFFLNGSSSDETDASDKFTDKGSREKAPSASRKAASGISKDQAPSASRKSAWPASGISSANKNQRQNSAQAVTHPPWPSKNLFRSANQAQTRFGFSSSKKRSMETVPLSAPNNKSHSRSFSSSRIQEYSNARTGCNSNLNSNSEAHKPRRKRRPKKKKQQGALH
ncbi:rRNA-processing protein EFG1 [Macleaya cordata]|uniref:rRNA-processing protein EFG1 n=1 Tax=Macleaya cordata TaxID=56857 RepID=A0A200PSQ6_MACCD|nr:rRNA-processing protein EFG1 [Macleaya cordata]